MLTNISMERTKRSRSCTSNDYRDKRRRTDQAATNYLFTNTSTCLEDLSNELIYEIFEFLDLQHVYEAFYFLNSRFTRLITHSTLSIRLNASSISKPSFEQFESNIIRPNQDRIHSLHLFNQHLYDYAFSPFHTFSQFPRLQTLRLNDIESKQLPTILPSLASLQYLSALSISTLDNVPNTVAIYCEIFRLPALKYCKLAFKSCEYHESITIADRASSSIEHLIILSGICTDQISNLLSYVPQLRRLYVCAIHSSWTNRAKPTSSALSSLTHLSLDLSSLNFNRFEQLVGDDAFRRVEVLYISIRSNSDQMYTDAKRWEHLISSYMPNLRLFDIHHESWRNVQQGISTAPIDQFTSSFWTRRQWFFTQESPQPRSAHQPSVFYSVNPYRRKYYILREHTNRSTCLNSTSAHFQSVQHIEIHSEDAVRNCHDYFANATVLTLRNGFTSPQNFIAVNLNRLVPLQQLTKVVIECRYLSLMKLMHLLRHAPHVRTLIFDSFPLYGLNDQSIEENETCQFVSRTNVITDVTFRRVCRLDQVRVLMACFNRMENLKLNIYAKDLQSVVGYILNKIKDTPSSQLHMLCLTGACKIWLRRVTAMLFWEELLTDYVLKMVGQDLYLWW